MAASMASKEGLQRTRLLRFESPFSSLSSTGGLSVSKHITPSKQSSSPNLLRTFATWALSALVKICNQIRAQLIVNIVHDLDIRKCVVKYAQFDHWDTHSQKQKRKKKGKKKGKQLTIFRCGIDRSRCLKRGSGFNVSYGSVPWTLAWNSSSSNSNPRACDKLRSRKWAICVY